jgi:hypothetical protein
MQFLAGFQIELIDHADDGLRRLRTQRLDQGPQYVLPLRGIDEDRAARIEAETVKAVTGQATALARAIGRHHEDNFFPRGRKKTRQYRHDETEGGWECNLRCRNDLMQRAADEAAMRQVRIKWGQFESQPRQRALRPTGLAREPMP